MERHSDLRPALQQLLEEAESEDGVARSGVDRALVALPVAEAQLAALKRILRELDDDGITDAALEQARDALGH